MRGKKSKKVYIPVDKYPDINFMGLLIGPRGSNQKRMEEGSGARILIRGKGSSKEGDADENDDLHVLITGDTDTSIQKAQTMVEEILYNPEQAMQLKREQLRRVAELNGTLRDDADGSGSHYGPSSDYKSIDLPVPRTMVGYIIGRGGETIRDLQMKSGAHIQVVREQEGLPPTSERSVSIGGSDGAIEKAKELIAALINERSNGGGYGPSGGTTITPDPDGLLVSVPNEKVGLIIGKSGATIRSIQSRTGATIQIPSMPDSNDPTSRIIQISGSHDAKEAAQLEVVQLVQEAEGAMGGTSLTIQVPNDRVGFIIGKRGETIRGIQERTGSRVQIPPQADVGTNPPIRTLTIVGKGDGPQLAKYEIEAILTGGQYGNNSTYQQYTSSSYYDQSGYYDQYGQYQYYAQAYQGYDQQYSQDAASTATANNGEATATSADGTSQAQAYADPNSYWNGYYEYAAYYGVEAANAAWGVTTETTVQTSAEGDAATQDNIKQVEQTTNDVNTGPPGTS